MVHNCAGSTGHVALFTVKISLLPSLNPATGITVAGDPNLDDKG
jgi:hypothetical protein